MTEPTDKELEAFAVEEQFLLFCDVDEFTQIARAVLAKWGHAASGAGEPMEMCLCESHRLVLRLGQPYIFREMEGCESCKALADQAREAYGPTGGAPAATPQPTQAQAGAVPLTDEQLAEMMRETWGCASIAPRHAIGFARAIERAHGIGIKGGQHGAE